ncbi:MAG: hypothetical protein ACAI44_01995, partial [Candidatus Sericytochromatia bacterium]
MLIGTQSLLSSQAHKGLPQQALPAGLFSPVAGLAADIAGSIRDTLKQQFASASGSLAGFFFLDDDSHDRGEFDSTWREYRDAESEAATASSADQLRAKLGIDADWSGAGSLKELVGILKEQGRDDAKVMTWLEQIGSRHGKSTLEALAASLVYYHKVGTRVGGVTKTDILCDALHDVAWPSDIAQRNRGTCGAAAIQMKLALERPQQYVSTLLTLAQGKSYTTPVGAEMKANNTWVGDSGDARTLSCRIMQNSIMNLGGKGLLWDNTYDSSDDDNEGGLDRGEQTYAIEQIFGDSDYDNDGPFTSASALYRYVEDDIARGRSVSVSFKGHAVLVVGIDKSQSQTKLIMNSWGRQFEMTVDEFKRYVKAARTIDDSGSDNRTTAAGSK